jgi:hypothetical protein
MQMMKPTKPQKKHLMNLSKRDVSQNVALTIQEVEQIISTADRIVVRKRKGQHLMTAKAVSSTIVVMFVLVAVSMSVTSWFAGGGSHKSTQQWFQDNIVPAIGEVCNNGNSPIPPNGEFTKKFTTHDMKILELLEWTSTGPQANTQITRWTFKTLTENGDIGWNSKVAEEAATVEDLPVCDNVTIRSVDGGKIGAGTKNITIEEDPDIGTDGAVIVVEDAVSNN